jgi:hypothetical protein
LVIFIVKELKGELKKPLQLLIDDRSPINLAKNLVSHERSRDIETKFHFIRKHIMNGKSDVVHCPTKPQLAYGFTKVVKL